MKSGSRLTKIAMSCVLALTSMLVGFGTTGCTDTRYNRNEEYLLGVCEKFYAYNNSMEQCLTIEYVSDVSETMGFRTYRLGLSYALLFTVNEQNEPVFREEKKQIAHDIIDSLKSHGVERICVITDTHLQPYDYHANTDWAVPDPLTEPEYYQQFLQLYEKASAMIAEEFPEVKYFEPGNEPDHESGRPICKNGYTLGAGTTANANFIYSDDDIAHIVSDICWYVSRGVKSVDPENTVVLPGLCNYYDTHDFLELIYEAIESRTLPTGEQYAEVDPDQYFQILSWHPYLNGVNLTEIDETWVDFQKEMYAVAQRHGDDGKLVWFTETGFTDRGNEETEQLTAQRLIRELEYIKNELPFVETACIFRITDLASAPVSDAENHFGIFRSRDDPDPDRAGEPKPIALALYRYMNGEDADVTSLYRFMRAS